MPSGEVRFFKGVAPGRYTTLQWKSSYREHVFEHKMNSAGFFERDRTQSWRMGGGGITWK